ncbi:predicted protein [Thalassiosira pseudonana CCMP1335]|uniref:Uncharacterized protein n=1 Tax=Thalassiosira pseudonana TaxID=35128 RepID=B8C9D1_THAPS|nr:predicted protein [Thalassiosira pseudonana CCMP1335]EED90027.1 predicted protein [Thalassiosira pseudonana CCMP1335]
MDDFHTRALSSLHHQIAHASIPEDTSNTTTTSFNPNIYAKSLVEDDDIPKIDSAVKSYLSLVAARSVVASDIDVISVASPSDAVRRCVSMVGGGDEEYGKNVQCTFTSSTSSSSTTMNTTDANRCALACARTLLTTINSTCIPQPIGEDEATTTSSDKTQEKKEVQMQNDTIRILWNGLVNTSTSESASSLDKKQLKPSKLLGRNCLMVAYPYVVERFHRGVEKTRTGAPKEEEAGDDATAVKAQSNPMNTHSDEVLPPVLPPKGIDVTQWQAFYVEFGNILKQAVDVYNKSDDSTAITSTSSDCNLVWATDKGVKELERRRQMRALRASEALAAESDVATDSSRI